MSQNSYTLRRTAAFEGMNVAGEPGQDLYMTGFDPTNELFFGRAVIRGADDNEIAHPSGSAGTFMGVAVHSHSVDPDEVTLNDWPADKPIDVKRQGLIWVVPESNVVQGNGVYYRHANAGALPEALGRFRNDDDSASGDVTIVSGAVWYSSASAGGLALLALNMP